MSIHDLADALAGMSLDLPSHSFVELFFFPHRGEGMACIIGKVFSDLSFCIGVLKYTYVAEDRSPKGVDVCTVISKEVESAAAQIGYEVFGALAHPMLEEGKSPIVDRDLSCSIYGLAFFDGEVPFLKVDGGAFGIEQLARSYARIYEHQDHLNVFVAL